MSSIESAGAGEVLGREEELEALEGFIAEAALGPTSFLLEGEPGIGKTTLWRAGVAAARQRSYRVLSCRPAGGEVRLSFAGLGDLLAELPGEALKELPTPQRRALEVALLLEESSGAPPDQRAIGMGLLGVLRLLAHSQPVLMAIDDAQWLDGPTAAVLEFALRRLREEPVSVLVAARIEAERGRGIELARTVPEKRQFGLRVGPLDIGALQRLVSLRVGVGPSRPILRRIEESSGGNPFYALELGRALESASGTLEAGGRLPVPESLQELVRARLETIPAGAEDVLLAVAALSDPTVSAVEAVTESRARPKLEAAVAAGVLEMDGDRIAFTHPLLASGVYSRADLGRRRGVHRRLAVVVQDLEAQARHLALGVPGRDGEVAAALDQAAREASARGAPDAAAELLELAVEVTPLGRQATLRRRKLEAADAHFRSGAIGHATRILQALLDELPPGDERAAVLLRLASETVDLEGALVLVEQAEREAVSDHAVRSGVHLLLGHGWPMRGMEQALRDGRKALEHAEASGRRRLVVEASARLALWELWTGRDVSGLLERAVALEDASDGLRGYETPRTPLALLRMYQGRLEEARSLFETLFAEALGMGDEIASLDLRGRLVDIELRAGNWSRAAAHAATTFELAEQIGLEHAGMSVYWKAFVAAHLGRVEDARIAAGLGIEFSRSAKRQNHLVMNLGVLGFLELSLGNEADALPCLRPLLNWVAEKGLALAPHPIAPYALEALVAGGELEEAGRLHCHFEREARTLDSPWGLAIADRCRGLLAAAEGDLPAALTALDRALARHACADWPFERARTLMVLGRTQRRAKRKSAARRSLEEALMIFEGLGAGLWSERAVDEIRRIGLRPAAPKQLTETEQRVAELAASGLRNREVAAQLFMSPKTVEANLARAYRKLGIHSRAELGTWLAKAGREPEQT